MSVLQRLAGGALLATRVLAVTAVGIDAGLRTAAHTVARSWGELADPPTSSVPPEPAPALLIDLDNLGVRRARLRQVLGVLLDQAQPLQAAYAAGHPTLVTTEVRQVCRQLGIEVLEVDPGPNAADRALLSAALKLHATGVDTWYVASHDAVFSALPGSLTVLCTGAGRPAGALVQRAAEVRHVA